MPDKMSQEKISMLRAYGAEVVITPDRGRPGLARELLLRLRPPRRGDPRRLQARPVLESRQSRGPLRDDRARALGADGRGAGGRDRDLGRHRRHDHRRRALLQGAQAGGADRRRSTPKARSSPPTTSTRWGRTSSRASARSAGRRRSTPMSSTSGCASPTATRSVSRAGSRARRGCSWAAPPARPRTPGSRLRSGSVPTPASS